MIGGIPELLSSEKSKSAKARKSRTALATLDKEPASHFGAWRRASRDSSLHPWPALVRPHTERTQRCACGVSACELRSDV